MSRRRPCPMSLVSEADVGSFRARGGGTYAWCGSEVERPVCSALSGKDHWYKPMVKSGGGQRGSYGAVVPVIAVRDTVGGKGPDFGDAGVGGNRKGMAGETIRPNYPGGVYAP